MRKRSAGVVAAWHRHQMKQDGSRKCLQGHALKPFATDLIGYSCSRYAEIFPPGSEFMSCRDCNFDLCSTCTNDKPTAPASSSSSHSALIWAIQHPPPEHDAAMQAVHDAPERITNRLQALMQAGQELAQAEEQLLQPDRFQMQAVQRACRWEQRVRKKQQALVQAEQS